MYQPLHHIIWYGRNFPCLEQKFMHNIPTPPTSILWHFMQLPYQDRGSKPFPLHIVLSIQRSECTCSQLAPSDIPCTSPFPVWYNRDKKAIIRVSCYSNPKKGMPTGTIKNKPSSFPIYPLHKNLINLGTTKMYVLYGLLRRSSNNKSRAVSIAAGKGVLNILSPLCYS